MEHDRIGGAQDLRWTYRMEGSGRIIKDGWHILVYNWSQMERERWRMMDDGCRGVNIEDA